MRVIAIDPGYERMGVAVLDRTMGKDTLLYSSCVITPRELEFSERLGLLTENFREIVREWQPHHLAIEKLFFNTNQKTVMRVAEARGALIEAAARESLQVYEYSPLEIKLAVTGFGQASKAQVADMVRRLLVMTHLPKHDDEYDAVACGITHLATARDPQPGAYPQNSK